mmetsp:Transcript_9188/g.21449  ORF Transcript_9188/g.21449 Transcript_9188/m.21449 type:complete len:222 (-) Transcript_9188:182-847(-)
MGSCHKLMCLSTPHDASSCTLGSHTKSCTSPLCFSPSTLTMPFSTSLSTIWPSDAHEIMVLRSSTYSTLDSHACLSCVSQLLTKPSVAFLEFAAIRFLSAATPIVSSLYRWICPASSPKASIRSSSEPASSRSTTVHMQRGEMSSLTVPESLQESRIRSTKMSCLSAEQSARRSEWLSLFACTIPVMNGRSVGNSRGCWTFRPSRPSGFHTSKSPFRLNDI